ncbi:hypothetical protein EV121DRAFT_297669 [Schizophyllum commune]
MASRYVDDGRVSSAFEVGEVAVVVIPRMECNVAVTRACSPGALSLELTTGQYRTLASRSSIAFLFSYDFALDIRLCYRPLSFALDLGPSPPTSASRSRPTGYATYLRRFRIVALDRPAQDHVLVKSLSKIASSLPSKIRSSSPTHAFALIKDRGLVRVEGRVLVRGEGRVFVRVEGRVFVRVKGVRGKHNARRRFLGSFLPEDNNQHIVRGKYKGTGEQGHPGPQEEMGYPGLARIHYRRSLVFITTGLSSLLSTARHRLPTAKSPSEVLN